MIIDAHHHFVPKEMISKNETIFENGIPKYLMHEALYLVEERLEQMNDAGIDMAILSCPQYTAAPLDICRKVNESIAKVKADYPKSFLGLAVINPLEGREALVEGERAIKQLGLNGFYIPARFPGLVSFDDEKLFEFYEMCEALQAPIQVHPPNFPDGGHPLLEKFDLYRIIGREIDLNISVLRLIYSGVLDRFPTLKFVFAHQGGGISNWMGRIKPTIGDTDDIKPWASYFPKTSKPIMECFKQLYFDTAGFADTKTLETTLKTFPPANLCFGTDYPQDMKETHNLKGYLESTKALLSPADQELVFCKNIEAIYNLKLEQEASNQSV